MLALAAGGPTKGSVGFVESCRLSVVSVAVSVGVSTVESLSANTALPDWSVIALAGVILGLPFVAPRETDFPTTLLPLASSNWTTMFPVVVPSAKTPAGPDTTYGEAIGT